MRNPTLSALMALLLISIITGCGEDDLGGSFPEISVPDSVTFPTTQIGQSVDRPLLIENVGSGRLIITDLIFTNETDTGEFSHAGDVPFAIEAGESYSLTMTYAPDDLRAIQVEFALLTIVETQTLLSDFLRERATSDLVASPGRVPA